MSASSNDSENKMHKLAKEDRIKSTKNIIKQKKEEYEFYKTHEKKQNIHIIHEFKNDFPNAKSALFTDSEYSNLEQLGIQAVIKQLENRVTLNTSVILVILIFMIPIVFTTENSFELTRVYVIVLLAILSIVYLIVSWWKKWINKKLQWDSWLVIELFSLLFLIIGLYILNSTYSLPIETAKHLKSFAHLSIILPTIVIYLDYIRRLLEKKTFYEQLEIINNTTIKKSTLDTKKRLSKQGALNNSSDELADLSLEESGNLKLKVNKNIPSMPNTDSQSQVEIIYSDAKAYKVNVTNNIKTLE